MHRELCHHLSIFDAAWEIIYRVLRKSGRSAPAGHGDLAGPAQLREEIILSTRRSRLERDRSRSRPESRANRNLTVENRLHSLGITGIALHPCASFAALHLARAGSGQSQNRRVFAWEVGCSTFAVSIHYPVKRDGGRKQVLKTCPLPQ